jgi:DNA replication and repair protein RecF
LLQLKDISLTQFRNYDQAAFPFRERIIGICGRNGVGKTNLLDAIYYLCFTRSYFTRTDQQNVSYGANGFRIAGHFEKQAVPSDIVCIYRGEGKKEVLHDQEAYEKFSAHIGQYTAVVIAPDDVQIITGGSEERRRMLDTLLAQLDPGYLGSLIEYNKVLRQRNGLLRGAAGNRLQASELSLLDVYDEQLLRPGLRLFEKRAAFLQSFFPLASDYYRQIAGTDEPLSLAYRSALLDNSFQALLLHAREKDIALQRTTAGIHRDDIAFGFSGQPFKNMASQGQRKSLLFALKLAEYDSLRLAKGFSPILLLDDVFEKLDEIRMRNLLDRVCLLSQGQIFITDTHAGRIETALDAPGLDFQIIRL